MGKYTRLSMRERCNLATFLDMGLKISEIASRLDRHRSTIYRELSRNSINEYYQPGPAHHQAKKRHPKKALKLQTQSELYHYVYDRLKRGWSPEQIVGRMRLDNCSFDICSETIYRYVYQHGHKKLWRLLPTRRKQRRSRRAKRKTHCRYGDIRLITKRPKNIEQRLHLGHWEGDLIEFSGTKQKTVTTLVERKTRLVILLKNKTKISQQVMNTIYHNFTKHAELKCKTITFDQGGEFADYRRIESGMKCKVYYCQTRSPWQKGSNENMNGRLRRYLPRHTDINHLTQQALDQLTQKMNTTPRKCLGFRTPKELFLKHINKNCRTRM